MFRVLFLLSFYVTLVTGFVSYNWDNNSTSTQFIDLSNQCTDNLNQDIFIPFGVGAADGVSLLVSQISSEVFPKCNLYFHIARDDENHLQIVVIEYLDNRHSNKEMIEGCKGRNRTGYLTLKEVDPDGELIQVCDRFRVHKFNIPVFVHTGFAKVIHVQINATEIFHSIKITLTAARALGRHEYCNSSYEIQCTIGRETICINKALSCDKNINCGVFDENDEDYKICQVNRFAYLWIVVLAGLGTFILVFIIFLYLLKTYIVEITDNFFIFNEDEDNKLVIRSQLNSHVWQNIRKFAKDRPCFCRVDKNAPVTSDQGTVEIK